MALLAGHRPRPTELPNPFDYAEYVPSADQTINDSTVTTLAYATANFTTAKVTKAVADVVGHSFTLNSDGYWAITVNERYSALATGERAFSIAVNGLTIKNVGHVGSASANSSVVMMITQPFANGDVIKVQAFQASGGSSTRVHNVAGAGRISICLLWQ